MENDEKTSLLGTKVKPTTWKTHLRACLTAFACCLASGLLLGYPTILPNLAATGIFTQGCPNGNATNCVYQAVQFQNLYNVGWSTTNIGIFFVGIFFDRFGARVSAVTGAIVTAVGTIPLWAATNYPGRADWLMYIGFPTIQIAGQLNSFAVLGFLWHYSQYQAFILGVGGATTQISALAAYALSGLANAGLPIQYGFLVLGGAALVAAIICWFSVPSQEEYFAYAESVLHVDPRQESPSVLRNLRDTLNVMWQIKGATILSFICIGAPFVFIVYWTSAVDNYWPLILPPTESQTLTFLFAILVSALGGAIQPFLGILMDKIGPFWLYSILAGALGTFVGTLFVFQFAAQLVSMIAGITYQTIWTTFAQRWCVYLTPPQLIGSYIGVVMAFVGAVTVVVTIPVATAVSNMLVGSAVYIWPLAVMSGLSLLATMITLVYLRVVGVPDSPPTPSNSWKNGLDRFNQIN